MPELKRHLRLGLECFRRYKGLQGEGPRFFRAEGFKLRLPVYLEQIVHGAFTARAGTPTSKA